MSEEDFQDHVPLVHHVPHKNLWQRWMAWSGSFLVVSILLHIILLGGAAIFVVQVVQSRKEKLKFTAAPPSASASAEHKVKPSKKTSAPAPAVSKRITSMDVNAKVVLPAMDMTSSTGPDVMASVMSGMGAQGLGAGSAGGAAGMASMPVAGLTAFGFKGSGIVGGLKGQIYDLKQTPDHKPTDMIDDGLVDATTKSWTPSVLNQIKFFDEFFKNWEETMLEKYFRAKDSVTAFQVLVPGMASVMGPKAFGVEKEIPKACHWMVLYKGVVTAPKDGTFRFLGRCDDMIAVRFNNQNVFVHTLQDFAKPTMASFSPPATQKKEELGVNYGKWFSVSAGTAYPIEVAIAEMPGGYFTAQLYIEDKNPATPYPHRTHPGMEKYLAYPVFQLKKDLPLPKRETVLTAPPNANPNWAPRENYSEVPPEPLIFPGK